MGKFNIQKMLKYTSMMIDWTDWTELKSYLFSIRKIKTLGRQMYMSSILKM